MNITNANTRKQPTVKFTLNLPTELRKRLRLHCAQEDRTMSSLIIALVESYLRRLDQDRKAPTMEETERWRRGR
jgi:hypothetical protein